jgi:murein DD-endopeptidase MepM/ murein hydrolase activator NlpD
VGGAYLGLSAFRASSRPSLILTVRPEALGPSTRITAMATATGRGLAEVRLELVQGEKVTVLVSQFHAPRPAHAFWGPRTTTFEIASLELGREALARLDRGNATLRLVAARAPSWLLAPEPAVREVTLPVRREPPSLSRRTAPVVVSSGGSGVVVYEVGPTAVRDGLSAGGRTFPGFPLPGGTAAERFVLFGLPIDVADRMAVVLFAEDEVGNRAEAPAVDRIALKAFPADTIVVRDDFLAKVVPEIVAHSPEVKDRGDRLQTFLAINNDLRRANAEALDRLAAASVPHFLWSRSFLPLPRSQVMSAFADRRSYVYAGREVDKQVHFGFDLAATRNTEVPAGNDGVVALARYLGIYGNAVVLDHGYGLMSLYAHLSALDVVEGQSVARGDTLGRTGATGLAGGDHLHFTLLVHGIPVNPNEWWDPHWIKDHVLLALGPALPFTE